MCCGFELKKVFHDEMAYFIFLAIQSIIGQSKLTFLIYYWMRVLICIFGWTSFFGTGLFDIIDSSKKSEIKITDILWCFDFGHQRRMHNIAIETGVHIIVCSLLIPRSVKKINIILKRQTKFDVCI